MSSSDDSPWMAAREAARYSGHHYSTIVRRLQRGELHGHQRYGGASWRVHINSLEAWIRGDVNNAAVCGCVNSPCPAAS